MSSPKKKKKKKKGANSVRYQNITSAKLSAFCLLLRSILLADKVSHTSIGVWLQYGQYGSICSYWSQVLVFSKSRTNKNHPSQNAPAASTPATPAPAPAETDPAPAPATTTTTDATTQTIGEIIKQGEDEAHTFIATDDAKLIEMKAAGKTWKEIVAELKKSQPALKERFKEIGPKASGGRRDEKKKEEAEAKASEDKKEAEDRASDGKKDKDEGESEKGATLAKKVKKSAASETTKKVSKHVLTFPLLSPPLPSPHLDLTNINPSSQSTSTSNPFQDPRTLAEIAAKYDQDKWRYAASKYYDLTGERISKEEARRRALAG